jgi:hypothetical protein
MSLTLNDGVRVYCGIVEASPIEIPNEFIITDAMLVMRAYPLGYRFLHHFMHGRGTNLIIPTEGLIENDIGVKDLINSELKNTILEQQGSIPIPQRTYRDRNYQLAFGSLNMQWKVVQAQTLPNGTQSNIVDIWFYNSYRWHEAVARVSQCMHRAFSRSSGREYYMIGKRYFYKFLLDSNGNGSLHLQNQNSQELVEFRRLNQPAPHVGTNIMELYSDTRSYFEVEQRGFGQRILDAL